MKILCLDQFGELGGAQRCLLDLIPAMAERGWSVHVAAPTCGQLAERAAALHATVDPVRCGPYSSGRKTPADMARFLAEAPRLAGEIRRLVWRYDPDLIYVNGPRLLPAAALSMVRSARKGARVLFHSHSLLDGLALRLAGRSLAAMRAAIVASCRFVATPLLPYCGDRGVRVVYNGVRRIPPPSRVHGGGEFRIGAIGRISPEKGQGDFLRAARILHNVAPQCRFLVCGAPLFSDPAAMRYCAELEALGEGLPVEFAGWTEDVEGALARLDLLVIPSASIDATPRVILEGFAAGVPVVAFASGGIPEIVEHGVTGFLVEERSPRALAFAMLDALEAPSRRREAAESARAKARTEFSLERYRAEMLETMEMAVSAGNCPGGNREAHVSRKDAKEPQRPPRKAKRADDERRDSGREPQAGF
jgi:glycosyltransferase involved in cell wall biosynthesis